MKKLCNKCGRESKMGICTGCGEWASYQKCKCKREKTYKQLREDLLK